ncbi:MAG TPA: T9SS type A sorting domain-containing protein [Chitinophagaceae bacterium]
MRKSLRCFSLLAGTVMLTTLAHSQSDRFAWAITDIQKEGANWNYLRKINLQNGQVSEVLLNGAEANQVAFDAITKKEIANFDSRIASYGHNLQPAFSSGVAAMAFDKKNNRLWYTPMFIDQLRYVDVKTMKVYYLNNAAFTGMVSKNADQGNIITRMVVAEDGNGYAMTNDGMHLIRFSTGKGLEVADLGEIVDDPANKGFSIHSSCSSFGGDMIATNDGSLYVFSARNNVFKVNVETKVATYLGQVQGLPANFTTNGAAVTPDNTILISSAVEGTNTFFTVDHKTLAATQYQLTNSWRTSDLANGNLLNTKKSQDPAANIIADRVIPASSEIENNKIQVFPNPVTNRQFAIHFDQLEAGEYTIQMTDIMGRQILQRIVNVGGDGQTETIRMDKQAAQGFYLVKVIDKNSKAVFSKKLVVQ